MLAATKTAPFAALFLAATFGCRGASLGEPCAERSDCASDLQCLGGLCTPLCDNHTECGDGFLCTEDGECSRVRSRYGDRCNSELECGPNQACLLDEADDDGDGWLLATCQPQPIGAVAGSECSSDDACRSGSCNLGRCTRLCRTSSECPEDLTCTELPRLLESGSALFRGCLQDGGTIRHRLEVPHSGDEVPLLVPGNAVSVAVTTVSSDPNLLAGVFQLRGPTGAYLYRTPQTPDDVTTNPLRYSMAPGESTLLFPDRPKSPLVPGVYRVELGTALTPQLPASDIPEVTVYYKLDDSAVLDVNVYFLDLGSHPCQGGIGTTRLDASNAPGLLVFQSYLADALAILGQAGIELGEVTYHDITDRPELDALSASDLPSLLQLSTTDTGLNLFLVRSIEPGGIQVLSGGTPGAPRSPGSRTAGIAVSMDTLCYRTWPQLARVTAHAMARQMGLFRNREPSSNVQDPIADSSSGPENLMYYSEFGGTELSEGQGEVLRLYPGLR